MSVSRKLFIAGNSSPTGEQVFTSSGSWTAPKGVYRVSAVAIGRGGVGYRGSIFSIGGAGGGLGWKNDIVVTPEQTYTVSITSSGSYFISIGTIWGQVGESPSASNFGSTGGSFVGDSGGNGGGGSFANYNNNPPITIGGGGSAGNYNSDGNSGSSSYGQVTTIGFTGDGSGISGNDIGNYGYGGTEYQTGGAGVVQIRWGINKDYS